MWHEVRHCVSGLVHSTQTSTEHQAGRHHGGGCPSPALRMWPHESRPGHGLATGEPGTCLRVQAKAGQPRPLAALRRGSWGAPGLQGWRWVSHPQGFPCWVARPELALPLLCAQAVATWVAQGACPALPTSSWNCLLFRTSPSLPRKRDTEAQPAVTGRSGRAGLHSEPASCHLQPLASCAAECRVPRACFHPPHV